MEKVIESEEFKSAPYKVVIVHMPPIFTEWHGLIDVKEKFLPMLNEAGIDLMLSGHFHQFSHTAPGERGTNFPILINSNKDVLNVDVDSDRIKVDVCDVSGKILHSYSYPVKK